MFTKLIAAAAIALAATGCQNELALFPHASATPTPSPDPAPISHELRALWFPFPLNVPEDDRAYDCIFDGNRICGPNNVQGVAPGCYNDHAALVVPWPCHVVLNADGSSDVYGGAR